LGRVPEGDRALESDAQVGLDKFTALVNQQSDLGANSQIGMSECCAIKHQMESSLPGSKGPELDA
jgi:hypothetical protein